MKPKFKNNQKVACVDSDVLHINEIYTIAGNTSDSLVRLCAEEKYKDDIYYFIIDKNNLEYRDMFKEKCFISLKEYRKEKLNKINNDIKIIKTR
jgi:hypothetical protein